MSDAHAQWMATFGGLLRAKEGNLASQTAAHYADAGLRDMQAAMLPEATASETGLRLMQGANLGAQATHYGALTREVPANARATRGLQGAQASDARASARQHGATAGVLEQQTDFRAPLLKSLGGLGTDPAGVRELGGSTGTTMPFDEWRARRDADRGGATSGYARGGAVPPLTRGLRRAGPIGDVAEDRGQDTIPAAVRPGEYMLNPETVAFLGGGSYEQGVRELDQLIRAATGKEPGARPVGKSGEPGFALGGPAEWWDAARRAADEGWTRGRGAAGAAWDQLKGRAASGSAQQPAGGAWVDDAARRAAASQPVSQPTPQPASQPASSASNAASAPPGATFSGGARAAPIAPGGTVYVDRSGAASGDPHQGTWAANTREATREARAAARAPTPAGEPIYVSGRGAASTDPNMGEWMRNAEAKQAATRGGRWAAAAESAGRTAGPIAREAGAAAAHRTSDWIEGQGGKWGAAATVAGGALTAGEALSRSLAHDGFYDDPKVGVLPKAEQALRDLKNPAATYAGGAIGAGFGGVLGNAPGAWMGGTAGAAGARALANLVDDRSEALKAWEAAHPKPAASPGAAPVQAARDAEAGRAAEAARERGLRGEYDQYVRERGMRDRQALFDGTMKLLAAAPVDGPGKYIGDLLQAGRTGASGAAADARAAATTMEAHRKAVDEHIDRLFEREERDPETGKVTKVGDRELANRVRMQLGDEHYDVYSQPLHEVDQRVMQMVLANRMTEGANRVALEERGADALIPTHGLRDLRLKRDPDTGLRQYGVDWADTWTDRNAITAWDKLHQSFASDGDPRSQVLIDHRSGERVTAERVFRRPDGSFDWDAYRQWLQSEDGIDRLNLDARARTRARAAARTE